MIQQSLIVLVLCSPLCLAGKSNNIFLQKNSPTQRNSMTPACSFFQNTNSASDETNEVLVHSESSSQPVQSNSLLNSVYYIGSAVQVLINFLRGRNTEGKIQSKQIHDSHSHAYVIPTIPPRSQQKQFFHKGSTRAYTTRSPVFRSRQTRTRPLHLTNTDGGRNIGHVLKKAFTIIAYGKQLLPIGYKGKLLQMLGLGNILDEKKTSRRRKSNAATPSMKLTRKTVSRKTWLK